MAVNETVTDTIIETVNETVNEIIRPPTIDTDTVLHAISIILFAYLLVRIISYTITIFSERLGIRRITVKMVIPLLKFLIYGFALYRILKNAFNLSSTESFAFSGLLGAGLGFGLKDLLADVVGGIVITLENPFHIGDKIKMGEYYGEVIDIGLRSTKIVTPDVNYISVPNHLIFAQAVASANAGSSEMMVVIDLFIDSDSDAVLAMKILKEAVMTSKYVYVSKKRPFAILLKDYPFYRNLRAKAYVNDLRYEGEFESNVTRRAWIEFSKNDIKAPKGRPKIEPPKL